MKVLRAHDILPEPPLSADDPLRVMTVPEVARKLGFSKAHVFNVIRGKVTGLPPLPVLRIGRRVLIRHESLRRWMLQVEGSEHENQRVSGLFCPRDENLDRTAGA